MCDIPEQLLPAANEETALLPQHTSKAPKTRLLESMPGTSLGTELNPRRLSHF